MSDPSSTKETINVVHVGIFIFVVVELIDRHVVVVDHQHNDNRNQPLAVESPRLLVSDSSAYTAHLSLIYNRAGELPGHVVWRCDSSEPSVMMSIMQIIHARDDS